MKRVVITGVTSGIGEALLTDLVQSGYDVIAVSRNADKLKALHQSLDEKFTYFVADFSVLESVIKVLDRIQSRYTSGIDILINNAAIVPKKKKMTINHFEMQYQVNHLVPVLFTERLLPLLAKKDGKVITTGSDAHKRAKFDPDDIQGLKHYHSLRSYCRTKLYNLMSNLYYQDHVSDVTFYTVHPGRVKTEIGTKDTSKLYALAWRLFTRKGYLPEETVKTYKYLIEEDVSPGYYHNERPLSMLEVAKDKAMQRALMTRALNQLKPYLKTTAK